MWYLEIHLSNAVEILVVSFFNSHCWMFNASSSLDSWWGYHFFKSLHYRGISRLSVFSLMINYMNYYFTSFCCRISRYILFHIAEKISIDSQNEVTKHMISLDINWHEQENSWNKVHKIVRWWSHIDKLVRMLRETLLLVIVNILWVGLYLWSVDLFISFLFTFFFVTFYIISMRLIKPAAEQAYLVNIAEEDYSWTIFETISNIRTLKTLWIQKGLFKKVLDVSKDLFNKISKRILYFRRREFFHLFYETTFRLIILGYAVYQVVLWNFEVGMLAVIYGYYNRVIRSVQWLSWMSNDIIISKLAIMRMMEIRNEEPVVENTWKRNFPKNWKKLTITWLSFWYKNRKVLNDVNCEIKRWEKIWIVWVSWTWKSTLFKLFLKLYTDYKWSIQFDNIELRDIKRSDYIQYISLVPQETELFNYSLKENVIVSGWWKDKKKLFSEVCENSYLNEFIDRLPNGHDTIVWEKWIKLSWGERQRVWIARALYKDPQILFLDEATSHLDSESESKIQDSLKRAFQWVTAIVIAHRLSTLKEMDRIIYMEKGNILEEWTFRSLIRKRWGFYKLWKKQKF